MKEAVDHEIMLFGKNISFPENCRVLPAELGGESGGNDEKSSGFDNGLGEVKVSKVGEVVEDEQENNKDCLTGKVCESGNHYALSESYYSSEITSMNEDLTTQEPSKNENDQSDATNSEQKTLKKPDKILPCPRCKSMDTKFCYYNNYNVNQPRHFCKRCQRYWTAGGTMRNVPVGAGRRKNKNSASHCQQITISESLRASQIDTLNGYNFQEVNPNGTILSFGIDSPRWESMAPVSERNAQNSTPNGCYIPYKGGENGDDCSSGSSVTTSNSIGNEVQNRAQESVIQNINGFQSQIPCLPGIPWPYMCNPSYPMPTVSPLGFHMPFYHVPYWNYNIHSPWSTPSLSPTPLTAHQNQSCSDTDSPILGKHTRDGELLKPCTPEGKETKESSKRSILVPKTLRIDDPEVAAKSSIWATLGIKYDSDNERRTMFNSFEPKYTEMKHTITASLALQANPVALSRSTNYHETA